MSCYMHAVDKKEQLLSDLVSNICFLHAKEVKFQLVQHFSVRFKQVFALECPLLLN